VGLILRPAVRSSLIFLTFCLALFGAPKLRLAQTVVGPVSVSAGTNGPQQVVEAWNAGDGNLNLQATGTALWTTLGVGQPGNCTTSPTGTCIPINIGFNTLSLAKGTYTTVVTISDPNAVDAPQTITVTVAIGGGVPDKVDLWITPNGTAQSTFTTNTAMASIPSGTQSGGNWLTVGLNGAGSFQFVNTYKVMATWQPGMTAGNTYTGSFTTTGSTVAAENKTVPVNLHATSGVVANSSSSTASFRLAQGAPPQTQYVGLQVQGTGFTASPTSSASWLAVQLVPGPYLKLTADPTGLSPGIQTATLTLHSNAANEPVTLPVTLEVIPQGPPMAYFAGVLTNSSTLPNVAPGTIAWMFGEQFTFNAPSSAATLPLDTSLNGVTVYLNNTAVPVYYVSYGQINFQIPFSTMQGDYIVRVQREGLTGNSVGLTVNLREPRILTLNGAGTGYGIIVNQDNSFPAPASYGAGFHPAKAGDWLVIYALGLGPTAPEVASGAGSPLNPLSKVDIGVKVVLTDGFFSTSVDAYFAGLTPNLVGLYQINFQVPTNAPKGDSINLALQLGGDTLSPPVNIALQ
jgi:uncharacterized protein (TIGR03437 family)